MKFKILLLSCLSFSGNIIAQTPTFQASVNNSAGTQSNQMNVAECDASGNVYFCGRRTDVITFGSSTLNSGIGGIYFGKANSAGAIQWLKGGGTSMPSGDDALDLVLDQNNNLYICGTVTALSPAIFDGVSMAFASPGFVLKLDVNGNVQWVKEYSNGVRSITVDNNNVPFINIGSSEVARIDPANGTILSSGSFTGNLMSISQHNIEADASNNIYVQGGSNIVKFDNALNQLWSTPVTFSLAETFKINLDNAGNVYATFYALFGTVTVGTVTKSNFPNGYIFKLDNATGQPVFVDSVLLAGAVSKVKEVIPDNAGNYYIMGDGAFNTPHVVKMTDTYTTLWDRALTNTAALTEINLISENCFIISGKHNGTIALDATTLQLPAGTSGIDNSMMTFLCDGNVSVDDGMSTRQLAVYPNPVTDNLNIEANGISEISIYDLMGRKIIYKNQDGGKVDVSDLTAGIYSLSVISNDGFEFTSKFIKE